MFGDEAGEVGRFKYLGCELQKIGGFQEDTDHAIKCGRMKRRRASKALCYEDLNWTKS